MRNGTHRQRVRQARKRLVCRWLRTACQCLVKPKCIVSRRLESTTPSIVLSHRQRVRQARKRLVCRWLRTACRNACKGLSHCIDSFNVTCEKYEPIVTNTTYKALALIGYLFVCYKAWTF